MKKIIRIKNCSKSHIWYADKIGKVYEVATEGADFFDVVKRDMPDRIYKKDCEVVQVSKIKIDGYQGLVPGDHIFKDGSIHKVVDPDSKIKEDENGNRGYWVNGSNGKPILILFGEFIIAEYAVIEL